MDDYRDITGMLKPRRDFAASDELRNRIDRTLDSYTQKREHLIRLWSVGATCIAAAALIFILIPNGMSAKAILAETLGALLNTEGVEMTVDVRTRPMENFRYIDLSEDFVVHNISIVKSDSTISWRIDKGSRTAIGNDTVIYNWIERLNIGWRSDNADPKELLGEMANLLTPEKILESELKNCISNPDTHYEVDKKNGEIVLTVHSKPKGDFSNPYMLNASIAESENIRRYVIDADTRHLKSASVCVTDGKSETEVLRIADVIYGRPPTDIMTLPAGVRFIDVAQDNLPGLADLTASEAASAFLNALESWNVDLLEKAVDANSLNTFYRNELHGAVLLSIGHAFTSGTEGNIYVPYTLLLPNGTVKSHNLVLQKRHGDSWIVVGGL